MQAVLGIMKIKSKWYIKLFYYLLDVAVVNVHNFKSESPNHLPTRRIGQKKKYEFKTQKAFVIEWIRELTGSHTSRKEMGRPKITVDL